MQHYTPETLTLEALRAILDDRSHGVLTVGGHEPPETPGAKCEMCVRELRALALGLAWTDSPDSPYDGFDTSLTDWVCIYLNDSTWSSDDARTRHCLPLALLSESTADEFWPTRWRLSLVREILPIGLRAAGMSEHVDECVVADTVAAAESAVQDVLDTARETYGSFGAMTVVAEHLADALEQSELDDGLLEAVHAVREVARLDGVDGDEVLGRACALLVRVQGGAS